MNINKCIRHLKVSTESKSLTSETLAKMSFIALKVVHCASCNMKYEQFKAWFCTYLKVADALVNIHKHCGIITTL